MAASASTANTSIVTPTPASLRRLCRDTLPSILGATNGKRIMDTVAAVAETDRWNSFDRFHETTATLVDEYEQAGAVTEVMQVQTGGRIGTGRWIIQEAQDVHSATIDVIKPIRERVADYKQNPWHVVQWSSSTPPGGVRGELIVLDREEQIDRLGVDGLVGRIVLTNLNIRSLTEKLASKGAAAVITDIDVTNNPNALAWTKFGWGMVPMSHTTMRLVGLVISRKQGLRLRRQLLEHQRLTMHVKVDVRKYVGHHDVVSGLIRGSENPQDEIWAIAHSGEPGAIDNASGCAVTVEVARALEGLIEAGKIPRPRRTIRLINAYECYGFFAYLERERRLQPPLAGINVDTVGAKPSVCGGRLEWHATVPSSAGFVDWVGEKILKATLRDYSAAGYSYCREAFMSTSDTLIGDPEYGYPCPWITTHHKTGEGSTWDAYHSSADQTSLMSAAGMKTCAAGTAAYLYYLANADTTDVVQMARAETTRLTGEARARRRRLDRAGADYLRDAHEESLKRLQGFLWGGDRRQVMTELQSLRAEMAAATSGIKSAIAARPTSSTRRIPRRTALLAPTNENVPTPLAKRISAARLQQWALYWANGQRTVEQIAGALSWEAGGLLRPGADPKRETVDPAAVAGYFEALAELGYVDMPERDEMLTRQQLVKDLRSLGLQTGMDVMVHSSMSKIGAVEGGAETVVDALLEVVGRSGTLLMPSFNHRAAQVYNRMATPTTNGAIPDAFWRRPDAVRSEHATHAVAALGRRAETYCANHLEAGCWAPESPIGQLVHGGGWLLALGVTHWTTTAYHVAEESVPSACNDPFGAIHKVVGDDGAVEEVWGLAFRRGPCPVQVAPKLDDALDRRGLQRRGKVGAADCEFVRAEDLYKVRREHLKSVCPTCKVRPNYPEQ